MDHSVLDSLLPQVCVRCKPSLH